MYIYHHHPSSYILSNWLSSLIQSLYLTNSTNQILLKDLLIQHENKINTNFSDYEWLSWYDHAECTTDALHELQL